MATDQLTATLIGGPTVLIEIGGFRVLTDPTFDPPGSYEARGIVLTKQTSPAITPSELGRVDLVVLSHDQHFDNFDRAGRAFLANASSVITTEAGAARLSNGTIGLLPWASTEIPLPGGRVLQVTATPARHGPVGIETISGDVIGFVLQIGAAYAFPNAKIIAVHNEGWAHFTQTQEDLAKAFTTLGLNGRLQLLERGVPSSLVL